MIWYEQKKKKGPHLCKSTGSSLESLFSSSVFLSSTHLENTKQPGDSGKFIFNDIKALKMSSLYSSRQRGGPIFISYDTRQPKFLPENSNRYIRYITAEDNTTCARRGRDRRTRCILLHLHPVSLCTCPEQWNGQNVDLHTQICTKIPKMWVIPAKNDEK